MVFEGWGKAKSKKQLVWGQGKNNQGAKQMKKGLKA